MGVTRVAKMRHANAIMFLRDIMKGLLSAKPWRPDNAERFCFRNRDFAVMISIDAMICQQVKNNARNR
jgi:hypothetical protein